MSAPDDREPSKVPKLTHEEALRGMWDFVEILRNLLLEALPDLKPHDPSHPAVDPSVCILCANEREGPHGARKVIRGRAKARR